MIKQELESKLAEVEKNKNKLTLMNHNIGISIRANNDFANEFLYPSKLSYRFLGGKIGLATCTDATILISQKYLPQFLRLFGEYAKKYRLRPKIGIKDEKYNFFTEEEKPVTYLEIYDRNEC